jgi:hypothetical protein
MEGMVVNIGIDGSSLVSTSRLEGIIGGISAVSV